MNCRWCCYSYLVQKPNFGGSRWSCASACMRRSSKPVPGLTRDLLDVKRRCLSSARRCRPRSARRLHRCHRKASSPRRLHGRPSGTARPSRPRSRRPRCARRDARSSVRPRRPTSARTPIGPSTGRHSPSGRDARAAKSPDRRARS